LRKVSQKAKKGSLAQNVGMASLDCSSGFESAMIRTRKNWKNWQALENWFPIAEPRGIYRNWRIYV